MASGPSSEVGAQIANVFKSINRVFIDSANVQTMRKVGTFAIGLIQKRTRLGFGVPEPMGQREKLAVLSPRYIEFRKYAGKSKSSKQAKKKKKKKNTKGGLAGTTTASKSNLTFTGQMIESLRIVAVSKGVVKIAPGGKRKDGLTNADVAAYVTDAGRPWLNISDNEQGQIVRFFRKHFGDLLKKSGLLK